MGRPAIYKKAIKENTIRDMKKIGVYRQEYIPVITIYSELIEQYNLLTKQFSDSDYTYFTNSEKGGSKKDPIVSTLESLRKDILQFAVALCLTPNSSATKKTGKKDSKKSSLSAVLSKIGR